MLSLRRMPPRHLSDAALAMMDSADRNGELVAHASSECTQLYKREVMQIRRHPAGHKTGLPEHEPAMLLDHAGEPFCPKHRPGRREGASAPPWELSGARLR
jgi:hypothetical protein